MESAEVDVRDIIFDPDVMALTGSILNALGHANGATDGKPVQFDPETAMEALLYTYSLMMDLHPELRSESDALEAGKDAGEMVAQMLRLLLAYRQAKGGRHAIEDWGATDPVMRKPVSPPSAH